MLTSVLQPPASFLSPSPSVVAPISPLVLCILKIHVFDFVQKYNDEWQLAKGQEVIKAGNSVNSRNRGVKSKREKMWMLMSASFPKAEWMVTC
jgi:hypothetical protein